MKRCFLDEEQFKHVQAEVQRRSRLFQLPFEFSRLAPQAKGFPASSAGKPAAAVQKAGLLHITLWLLKQPQVSMAPGNYRYPERNRIILKSVCSVDVCKTIACLMKACPLTSQDVSRFGVLQFIFTAVSSHCRLHGQYSRLHLVPSIFYIGTLSRIHTTSCFTGNVYIFGSSTQFLPPEGPSSQERNLCSSWLPEPCLGFKGPGTSRYFKYMQHIAA